MTVTVLTGNALDVLKTLPSESVHCAVSSPPYWGLRSYLPDGHDDKHHEIGLEPTPAEYVSRMVEVFREVRRVLRADGTCWVNLGDSYSGSGKGGNPEEGKQATNKGSQSIGVLYGKTGETAREAALTNVSRRWTTDAGIRPKQLIGIPWRVAFALQADGWYLRSEIIWSKPNPMPESVTDRPTKAHEQIFLLSKRERYFYDAAAIAEEAADSSGWSKQRASGINTWAYNASDERIEATGQRIEASTFGKPGQRNKRSVWTVSTKPFSGAALMRDYVGANGKPYIASPDCPQHGHLARRGTSGIPGRDERQGALTIRSHDSDARLVSECADESEAMTSRDHSAAPSGSALLRTLGSTGDYRTSSDRHEHTLHAESQNHSSRIAASDEPLDHKTDCCCPECAASAIDRSKETSRTVRADQTLQRDNAFAQTDESTQSTSPEPAPYGSAARTHENSISTDDSLSRPSAHSEHHNAGTFSSCNCSIASIDHFATFPPDLIEPMILAGCPAQACAVCGAPWEREVEVESRPNAPSCNGKYDGIGKHRTVSGGVSNDARERVDLGFSPSCSCNAGVVPGTVLDPFGGAGTTGLVADRLQRNSILIELNPQYAQMARDRITNDAPLFAEVA